jgi:TPR repeat protein
MKKTAISIAALGSIIIIAVVFINAYSSSNQSPSSFDGEESYYLTDSELNEMIHKESGDLSGKTAFDLFLHYSLSSNKNKGESERWLYISATKGCLPGMYNYGVILCEQGSTDQGRKWIERAAAAGDAHAQRYLLLDPSRSATSPSSTPASPAQKPPP